MEPGVGLDVEHDLQHGGVVEQLADDLQAVGRPVMWLRPIGIEPAGKPTVFHSSVLTPIASDPRQGLFRGRKPQIVRLGRRRVQLHVSGGLSPHHRAGARARRDAHQPGQQALDAHPRRRPTLYRHAETALAELAVAQRSPERCTPSASQAP